MAVNSSILRGILCGCLLAAAAHAMPDPGTLYVQALDFYEQKQYEKAVSLLEEAITLAPEQADYYHLLGKSYGRLAEQASWFTALPLARKTGHALERAVALDANKIQALADLIDFHQRAPGIAGGNAERAKFLHKRLMELKKPISAVSSAQNPSAYPED